MSTSTNSDPGSITARGWAPTPGAAVRQAATVVVLRRSEAGMQVLLMRRAPREGDIHSGACVFPGGLLDATDAEGGALCSGLDDAQASAKLGLPSGGLAYWFAALRECFEEAGLLYAAAQDRSHLDAAQLAMIATQRDALNRRELTMAAICTRFGIHLAAERIAYLDHWLTPPGVPKRYDTRFFVAEAPELQVATQDDHETDAQLWLTPAEGLARRKELKLAPPTWKILELLQRLGDVNAVLAHARGLTSVPCTMPRLAGGSKGLRPVMPDEPAYAEIGRIDPDGRGHASYDLAAAQPVRLSPRLIRVTADNGSLMTGPGTNCYLVGGGASNEWAALDPGPTSDAHVQAIVDAAPGPIRWIFVTHTHKDHSPAAQALKARTGAQLLGMAALHAEWQDTDFQPDVPLCGGERFDLPGDSTLHVIHTPGHAGNHLCYRLEQERLLFTGDHVMQGSTVVINPPDGDMGAYLRSLRELMELDLDWLAPGHGFLMPQPRRAMQQIVDHRLKREAKVLKAFGGSDPRSMDQLLAAVYDDVPPQLHAMARRSLTAHLWKLRDDGRVSEATNGVWKSVTPMVKVGERNNERSTGFTEGLHALLPKPCIARPFVCAGRPDSCTALLIGENPATTTDVDWWSFWDDEVGFRFEQWDGVMRETRRRAGKPEVTVTRLRINRLRSAGVVCLETNAFMNEGPAGHGAGKSNSGLLDLALRTLPDISTIIAHGKVAQGYLASLAVPSHIRIEKTKHFRLLSYEDIDRLAASIHKASRHA